jgi:muramoyltetrapeptide carboxypeptidase
MIAPPPLSHGNKVGIIATARRIRPEDIDEAIRRFRLWGLEPALSPWLFSEDHSYLAGTDEQRVSDLQRFLDDPGVAAVFCARGGYGTTRIIDDVSFSEFKKKPKWLVGFSDITALHLKLATLGFQSIHGTMPILFGKSSALESVESLRKAVFGEAVELSAPSCSLNRNGSATGVTVGGNLSLITDSLGTAHEIETKGRILIVEEVDEYLYKIDRMFMQLRRAKKLEHLAGLVVGHFSEMKDTELKFGESVEEIVRYHTQIYNYPIAFCFPTGHQDPNLAWISGGTALLEISGARSSLRYLR